MPSCRSPPHSGANATPRLGSPLNRLLSEPTHNPLSVTMKSLPPIRAGLSGFHANALPVNELIAPMPRRRTAVSTG